MNKVTSITVRMYDTGSVGDCLFLEFNKGKTATFRMLIDCGGYNNQKEDIVNCVKDIRSKLGNNPLDLVIVTHEHEDHISGFNQAKEVFDTIAFNRVWMAWTENPDDPLAKRLKTEMGKKLKALMATLTANNNKLDAKLKNRANSSRVKRRLRHYSRNWNKALELLHFESGMQMSAGLKLTNSDAMKYIKDKSKEKSPQIMYKKPGDVISDLAGAEGINFYILGPPYDGDLSDIRNKMQDDELYSLTKHAAFSGQQAFLSAVSASAEQSPFTVSPFHDKYRLKGPEEMNFNKRYNSPDMLWRQIEEDWLQTSGGLSLALGNYTNNTSLVIAIEFAESGKVLLFAGDAQSGNWVSWHSPEMSKKLLKNGSKNAKDLLEHTVLYKVGHHGSHNGTASKSGLENMTNDKLIAMMPLVQDKIPAGWGGSDNFPAKALYDRLIERTNGAIIRTDTGLIPDGKAAGLRKAKLTATVIDKLKKADMKLYKEWTVEA